MLECAASRRRTDTQISKATRIQTLVAGSAGAPGLVLGSKTLNEPIAFTS